jgi:hypothetical protein
VGYIHGVPRKLEPTYSHATAIFCIITNTSAGSSFVAASAAVMKGFTLNGTPCITYCRYVFSHSSSSLCLEKNVKVSQAVDSITGLK